MSRWLQGAPSVEPIIGFVEKQLAAPYRVLNSVQEVTDFLASRTDRKHALSTVMVVRTSAVMYSTVLACVSCILAHTRSYISFLFCFVRE